MILLNFVEKNMDLKFDATKKCDGKTTLLFCCKKVTQCQNLKKISKKLKKLLYFFHGFLQKYF